MNKPDKLRVATAQYALQKPSTLEDWRALVTKHVQTGADTGAQLLVFPEFGALEQAAALPSDIMASHNKMLLGVAALVEEKIDLFRVLAGKFNVHILAPSGPVKHADGSLTNTAHLVTPKGKVGANHKVMMTPFEADWGLKGKSHLSVFETNIGTIAITICYDSEFPILVRALTAAGADLILLPSCTEWESGASRIATAAQARALENSCAVVVSQTVGTAPWCEAIDHNTGRSGIYVPAERGLSDNGIITRGDWNEPGWVVGDIDFAALRHLHQSGEMRNRADWTAQPGGDTPLPDVEVISLL